MDILVVEDHKQTCDLLQAVLEEEGYSVCCVNTVAGAREKLSRSRPDLVVLDLALPDGSGLEVARLIRSGQENSDTPIIALTGRDKTSDKRDGFRSGVDQYLTKPIVMEEFVLWVQALMRRVKMDRCGAGALSLAGLEMNAASQLARYQGQPIPKLTKREFELLYALVKNSPKVFSRQEILSEVWHTVSVENLVDTHLFNLRKKLPPDLAGRIESLPGRGFRFLP